MQPILTYRAPLTLFGHHIFFVDAAAAYANIQQHNPAAYTLTPHRFPADMPGATLHYDNTCDGQPVLIIDNVAYGLAH